MKNNKLYIFTAIFLLSSTLLGCLKEDTNYAIGTENPEVSLYVLRDLYKDQDIKLSSSNLSGAVQTTALVVSRSDSRNLPANRIAIQNIWRNQRRGILVEVDDASKFKFGDSIKINLQGLSLTKENGILLLKGANAQNTAVISSDNKVVAFPISILALKNKFEEFESTYIDVTADVAPEPENGTPLEGAQTIVDGDQNKLTLYTSDQAPFAKESIAPSASFRGIAFRSNDEIQLRMQDYTDMAYPSGKLYSGWPETFETLIDPKEKGSYNMPAINNNVLFPTGQWNLYYSIIGTTSGRDRIVSGTNAIRVQQNLNFDSYIQMNFDVPDGASKITLWYGAYYTDRSSTFKLEYSTDQGANWTQVGESISDAHTTSESLNAKQAVFLMNIQGPVRFRINKLGLGTSNNTINNGRLGIDDIAIYKSY